MTPLKSSPKGGASTARSDPHGEVHRDGAMSPSALEGIRVIDLTTVVFGPYATQTLADYGADVIKVETPEGDGTRFNGPAREEGMGSLFLGVNRNKRSVVLDLKQHADREALLALCDTADVFIHNLRPQSLARLGLSAEQMTSRNPRLIFAALHGFGEGGPYAGAPAYDDVIQAMSGASDLMERYVGRTAYLPTAAADKVASLMAVHGVLAALFQRERTGLGQVIEVPMFECATSFLLVEHFHARHLAPESPPSVAQAEEMGYPRTLAPARRPYRTKDGSICLMPYTDTHWRKFLEAVRHDPLAIDLQFQSQRFRHQHIGALLESLERIVETQDSAHWLGLCRRLDIPCAPVHRLQDLEADPHLRCVNFFQHTEGADRRYLYPRMPVRMGNANVRLRTPPRLGEHTASILGELARRNGTA